jgi:hypothetical protein
VALDSAAKALNAIKPGASRDLQSAFTRDRSLIDEAAAGRTANAIRAMEVEAEVRRRPELRAERFVQDWQRLSRQKEQCWRVGDDAGSARITSSMGAMARGLERDAQAESLLRSRKQELGIGWSHQKSLSHELLDWLGISRGIGIGR